MASFTGGGFALALPLSILIALSAAAGDGMASTVRNTNAVMEANGFRLLPAFDGGGRIEAEDLSPPQALEVIRPDDRPLTIGRLFTSSRDIRLEAAKRTFAAGERALLTLRNVSPTPPEGQIYTVYVQLAAPMRTTLKFDAFIQSQMVKAPQLAVGPVREAGEAPESGAKAPADSPPPAALPESAGLGEKEGAAGDGDGEAEPDVAETREPDPEREAGMARTPTAEPAPTRPAEPAEEVKRDPALPFVSLITIGVSDMPRLGKFYENLGWRRVSRNPADPAVFFQLNGQALVLYPLADQLREQNMAAAKPAPGGVTLALHVAGKDEVTALYRKFLAAGASPLREPTEMPSGAVTCYVADPDGNPWEISWVPRFRMDSGGGLWLP